MAKVFVGKCPQCDSNVYQEEGEQIARCYFCGSVISAMPKADSQVKVVTSESEAMRKKKAAENSDKLMVAFVVMLGVLFLGLAVMVGFIGITYARQNLEARNEEPAGNIGSNFLNEPDEPYVDTDVEPVEDPNGELRGEIENIFDEDVPMSDVPQYASLTENECRAVEAAKACLDIASFSRNAVLEMLSGGDNPKYTYLEASNALDYMEENGYVDWYTQAIIVGGDYLDIYPYNKNELIALLTDETVGFTHKEAEFAADSLGVK